MKKITSIFLLAVMIISCIPITVNAEGGYEFHNVYETSGKCGDNLTFELDEDTGVLTVSGYGDMYFCQTTAPENSHITLTHMWDPELVKEMILPEGLTSLILLPYPNLKELNIPSTVEEIKGECGSGKFEPGSRPESVLKIPKNVKAITMYIVTGTITGNGPFSLCENFTSVEIDPDNQYFATDGHSIFSKDMTELVQIVSTPDEYKIPDTVEKIDKHALKCRTYKTLILSKKFDKVYKSMFESVNNLEKIVMPGVTQIEDRAFADCDALKYVDLGEGVLRIGLSAFAHCDSLRSIYIPGSVTYLHNGAFTELHTESETGKVWGMTDIFYPGTEEEFKDIVPGELSYLITDKIKVHYNWTLRGIYMDKWYDEGIVGCVERGVMTGTGKTDFSPELTLTRAQMVQILARVAGADLDEYVPGGRFKDVPTDAWYAKAVEWALENNITKGVSDDTFAPDEPVTREQFVTFMYALAGEDEEAHYDLSKYTDADQISDWAVIPFKWAIRRGMITGTSETTLSPKSTATRGQTAVIIDKYMNK